MDYKYTAKSHSNIALIKYWGKLPGQIPLNPSISFTLKKSFTEMKARILNESSSDSFILNFEDKRNTVFEKKILSKMPPGLIKDLKIEIQSMNTFPHSSGIASSASAMSCLMKLLNKVSSLGFKEAELSEYARKLSGSACRSIGKGFFVWGESPFVTDSSNDYAVCINENIHKDFHDLSDYILITDSSEKSVSSSQGHLNFMNSDYCDSRIKSVKKQFEKILVSLKSADWKVFSDIVCQEALELHALMLLSRPGFTLLNGKAIKIIRILEDLREKLDFKLTYTLDAGPNIHLIFHNSIKDKVESLLESEELKKNIEYIIKDEIYI